jgi:hypothetical protein
MLQIKGLFSLLLALLVLTSCNNVEMPDIEVCQELIEEDAFCTTTLTNEESFLTAEEWHEERLERFGISHEDFGEMKKFMLKSCELLKDQCSMKDMNKIFKKIEATKNREKYFEPQP